MTLQFKYTLALGSIIAIVILGIFLWLKNKVEDVVTLPSIPLPGKSRLAHDDRQLIEFNEKTHRVSVTTSSGTIKMYARNPAVHVKNDGRVTIDRHLLGLQSRLTAGIGYSDTIRGFVGYSPAYWRAFEASAVAGFTLNEEHTFVKPYLAIGYNFYGNLLINGGINPVSAFKKEVDYVAFLSVKL